MFIKNFVLHLSCITLFANPLAAMDVEFDYGAIRGPLYSWLLSTMIPEGKTVDDKSSSAIAAVNNDGTVIVKTFRNQDSLKVIGFQFFDVKSGNLLKQCPFLDDVVQAIGFDNNNKALIVSYKKQNHSQQVAHNTLNIWNIDQQMCIAQIHGVRSDDFPPIVFFNNDCSLVGCVTRPEKSLNQIRIFDIKTNECIYDEHFNRPTNIDQIVFSKCNQYLTIDADDNNIYLIAVKENTLTISQNQDLDHAIINFDTSSHDEALVTSNGRGLINFYYLPSLTNYDVIDDDNLKKTPFGLSVYFWGQGCRYILVHAGTKCVKLYDLQTHSQIMEFKFGGDYTTLLISKNHTTVVAKSSSEPLRYFDLQKIYKVLEDLDERCSNKQLMELDEIRKSWMYRKTDHCMSGEAAEVYNSLPETIKVIIDKLKENND